MKRPAPPVMLLGDGHDAIIQHTRRPASSRLEALLLGSYSDPALPTAPSDAKRILRYETAAAMCGRPDDGYLARRMRGEQLQHAWANGFTSPALLRGVVVSFRRRRAVSA